jgi:hypothetical protein
MAIAGFLRGIHEGMIFIRYPEPMHNNEFLEGARGHKWHEYYHILALARDLSMLGLGVALICLSWHWIVLLAGIVFMWELCEVGHAVARVKYPVMFDLGLPYEHIVAFDVWDLILRGNIVYCLHAFRIIVAVALLFA